MTPRKGPTPRRRAEPSASPPATGMRAAVERRSEPILRRLTRINRFALPALAALLLLAGLGLPTPLGPAALLLLVLLVGWLSYLSWPVLDRGGRVIRMATLALIVAAGIRRLILG